jgi:hypothetical protein
MSQDDWNFFFRQEDGGTRSIRLNLALRRHAPLPEMNVCVHAVVHLRDARADGFSGREEHTMLVAIENDLADGACLDGHAVEVACISGLGVRELIFYAKETWNIDAAIASVRQKFPQYRIDVSAQHDQEWRYYQDHLCPDVAEAQQMANRGVYASLKEQGDPVTTPREIDHWACFPSGTARDAFVEKVLGLGYTLRGEPYQVEPDSGTTAMTYMVKFCRTDTPCPGAFDDVTAELAELAIAAGGEYDGWETLVLAGDAQV